MSAVAGLRTGAALHTGTELTKQQTAQLTSVCKNFAASKADTVGTSSNKNIEMKSQQQNKTNKKLTK